MLAVLAVLAVLQWRIGRVERASTFVVSQREWERARAALNSGAALAADKHAICTTVTSAPHTRSSPRVAAAHQL